MLVERLGDLSINTVGCVLCYIVLWLSTMHDLISIFRTYEQCMKELEQSSVIPQNVTYIGILDMV